jgi:response regulator RpfG family c-di-GMP phosphodiesterase
MTKKILCVDDEANVLAAFQRQLRRQFEIETAQGGEQGLALIAAQGPYAVIVADMRMPGMNGVQFLTRVREIAPNSTRIMLTGNVDQKTATDAVNAGNIFRFLNKPCSPETLGQALTAGIEQYRLITAEKELLENTVRGTIKVLTEVLGMVNPLAFGRASRVQRRVRQLVAELQIEKSWEMEVAAMLSQLGWISVPEAVLHKSYAGEALSEEEARMVKAYPRTGYDLIANIPRLESIASAIAYQEKHYDGTGQPDDDKKGIDIPLGGRILKVVLDFERLESSGLTPTVAFERLQQDSRFYDPELLTALRRIVQGESAARRRKCR